MAQTPSSFGPLLYPSLSKVFGNAYGNWTFQRREGVSWPPGLLCPSCRAGYLRFTDTDMYGLKTTRRRACQACHLDYGKPRFE